MLSQSGAADADGDDGVVGLRFADGGGPVAVDRHGLLAVVDDVAVVSRRKSRLKRNCWLVLKRHTLCSQAPVSKPYFWTRCGYARNAANSSLSSINN